MIVVRRRPAVGPGPEGVVFPPRVCGEGALIVLREPRITVRVNGAGAVKASSASGEARRTATASVRSTVFGSRRTLWVRLSPPESVAVSRSSRYDGYSWSGAVNEPLATPAKSWTWCVWQFDGQWCRMQRPRERRGGQRPVLGVGGRAAEGDRVADLPGQCSTSAR